MGQIGRVRWGERVLGAVFFLRVSDALGDEGVDSTPCMAAWGFTSCGSPTRRYRGAGFFLRVSDALGAEGADSTPCMTAWGFTSCGSPTRSCRGAVFFLRVPDPRLPGALEGVAYGKVEGEGIAE